MSVQGDAGIIDRLIFEIVEVFSDHPGISLSKAARMIGMPRTTLKRKYEKLVAAGLIAVIP